MAYKVVILDDRYAGYEEEKAALKPVDAVIENVKSSRTQDIKAAVHDADGIIVNLPPVNEDIINSLAKCRVISRYGVGYDNVDVVCATERGIWVANVPDYCGEDVSDQAFALLMSCVRNVAIRDRQVKSGTWDIKSAPAQFRICGKTFGFLGFGQIARTLHRKLSGFNLGRVLVCDPFVDEAAISASGAVKADIETVVGESDYISIHMPLNDQTHGIFNEKLFTKMKKTAILINTSRGPIINEDDLFKALSGGIIGAAGLDVFTKEPVNPDNPLLTLDNITVSGHTGWYTEESQVELKSKAAANVCDVLSGKKPAYPVNKIEK